jgi:hypothetical protein
VLHRQYLNRNSITRTRYHRYAYPIGI